MTELLILFGVPCAVVITMHELEIFGYRLYPLLVRWLNFKPFTCELCMSTWTYFFLHGFVTSFDVYNILGSFIAGMTAYLLSMKFLKI